MEIVFAVLAVLVGAILVMALASGKSIDTIPWRAPVIVHRASRPREYWAGVFAIAVAFAFVTWVAVAGLAN